jgi:hypothetical protein
MFLFLQVNHTLTQSSFAMPCMKSDNGFASGFLPSNGIQIPFILVEFSDSMHTGSPMCKQPWPSGFQADANLLFRVLLRPS